MTSIEISSGGGAACAVTPAEIISTQVVRGRAGNSPSYVMVTLDPRVTAVEYTVHPTLPDCEAVEGLHCSGTVASSMGGNGFNFSFPVEKKMLYFIILRIKIDGGWHDEKTVTWLMDPFKRRPVARDDPSETVAAK